MQPNDIKPFIQARYGPPGSGKSLWLLHQAVQHQLLVVGRSPNHVTYLKQLCEQHCLTLPPDFITWAEFDQREYYRSEFHGLAFDDMDGYVQHRTTRPVRAMTLSTSVDLQTVSAVLSKPNSLPTSGQNVLGWWNNNWHVVYFVIKTQRWMLSDAHLDLGGPEAIPCWQFLPMPPQPEET